MLGSRLVSLGRAAVPLPGSQELGSLPSGQILHLGIALAPRNAGALASLAEAVNTPGSASFGHFITPGVFRAEFGPSRSSASAVTDVLRAEGFHVGTLSTNGLILPVTASVAVVQRALHVSLHSYRLPAGLLGWAATTAPRMQAPIASGVAAVLGLDDLVARHDFMERPRLVRPKRSRSAANRNVPRAAPKATGPVACSAAATGAATSGGWTFDQLAKSYGIAGLYAGGASGQGERVAIFELEPFSMNDIKTFDTCYFGVPAATQMLSRLSVVRVDGGLPTGSGSGEASLDVEDVSALAPGASIQVYEAPSSNFGTQYATDAIYNAMVNADSANVISTSWGLCEPAFEATAPGTQEVENTIFEEAAAQGQTVFAAAGDSGSNDCAAGSIPTSPALAVDDPASQPFVVGVGGTTLTKDTVPPVEAVWNDGPSGGGGGGGISATWPSPAWQSSSGDLGVANSYSDQAAYDFCAPTGDRRASTTPPCREVPDVSMDADEDTGTSWYQANLGGWSTIGGTSTAAPMWAAITTDIASSNSCAHLGLNRSNHERDLGFVAPALYEAASPATYDADFNDITSGSNDIFRLGKGYKAAAGYDLASGLGSPVVTSTSASAPRAPIGTDTALSASLCTLLTPSTTQPEVTGLEPDHGVVSGGNTVVLTGKGFSGADVSVEAVTFGATRTRSFRLETNGDLAVTVPAAAPGPGAGGLSRPTPGPVDVTVTVDTPTGRETSVSPTAGSRYVYTSGSSTSALPSVSGAGPSAGPVTGRNVIDVFGSGFEKPGSASPDPIRSVSFGGVRASSWKYLSDYELSVTVPAETKKTRCQEGRGFEPANTCQVQVVVNSRNGSSPTSRILPPYSGTLVPNDEGIVVPRAGTEINPAPSEYDYAPRPRITSVSPQPYLESSGAAIVVEGTGFNVLTFDWVVVGSTKLASDTYSPTKLTATRISLDVTLAPAGAETATLPGGVSVLSLGGRSNVVAFRYRE